jgi:hypothetical protein
MQRGGRKVQMKRKIDWLQFGQFLKMINDAFVMIREGFTKRKIGPEILEWITGPGKQAFQEFLEALANEYLNYVRLEQKKSLQVAKQAPLIAEVNLDLDPVAPFNGAVQTKHIKQGKVRFEYRSDEDELYINSKKFVPWLSQKQLAGQSIQGIKLEPQANKNNSLNATAADWIYEHPEFMPKKYQGKAWYFWASEWTSDGHRYVRYLFWGGTSWCRRYDWLGDHWGAGGPSASLAS